MPRIYKHVTDNNGYTMLYRPEHPSHDSLGYVREHRLVVEQSIGRLLSRTEIVHHKDGNPKNNELSNLLIVSPNEHHRYHCTWYQVNGEWKKRCIDCKRELCPFTDFSKGKLRCYPCYAAFRKAIVNDRKDQGLCVQCGSPTGGKILCETHHAAHLRNVKPLKKAMRARKKSLGLCAECKAPAAPGKSRCESHLAARRYTNRGPRAPYQFKNRQLRKAA